MKKPIVDYTLYRWRYGIGYAVALLLVAAVIGFSALYVPDGLRAAERTSAVASGSLDYAQFDAETVINLPYHLLQRIVFAIVGVSTLTIKLPSLILGVLTILGLFLLLREWFRSNVALTTSLIALTMPLFLFVSQDGTPTIYGIFTAVWLLLCATYVTRRRTPTLLWKIATFAFLSLNLYAPLGIYLEIAVLSTMIFHPHIRLLMRRLSVNRIAIAAVVAFILLTPLIYSIVMRPETSLELLGIPTATPDWGANAIALAQTLFDVRSVGSGPIIQPVLSLGLLSVVLVGVYRFVRIKYTARSYILWLWALLLVPLVYLNPHYTAYLFILIVMMVAMGIAALISEWYKMFPRNPYARVTGLIPLSLIVFGLVLSGLTQYGISYYYMPEIAQQFSSDTRLLNTAIARADAVGDNRVSVIVSETDLPYYTLLARYDTRFTPSTSLDVPTPYIVSHDANVHESIKAIPSAIITDRMSSDADRFYLYTASSD